MGLYRLNSLGYEGRIEIANSLDEIIALIAEFSHEDALFIGGNGQEAIIEIQGKNNAHLIWKPLVCIHWNENI